MKIVVGLGNPGARYETTRHNAGFLAVDRLMDAWEAGPVSKKFGAEIAQAEVSGEKVLLMKPQTFMNLSGQSVGPAYGFYKCSPKDVIVIHDELDLKPLSFRLKTGGGLGGHNGLKSVEEGIGSADFHRVRIGVGHPRTLGLPISPVDYVLQPFSDEELERLDGVLDSVAKATAQVISGDVLGAMTIYNRAGD